MKTGAMNTAVIFGDTHFPYHDGVVLDEALEVLKQMQPTYAVQIGDLYDYFHFSRYPKKLLSFEPLVEVRSARQVAEKFWKRVQALSPHSKCIQMLGNHDIRPMKLLLERAPELEPFVNFDCHFKFDGVKTVITESDDPNDIPKESQELQIELMGQPVILMHGHRSRLGDHLNYNGMSTICGHSHTGGVFYKKYKFTTKWELNVGYLANPNAGPLKYGKQSKRFWTPGVGVVDQMGPRFIPINV